MTPRFAKLLQELIHESEFRSVYTYCPGPDEVPIEQREVQGLFLAVDETMLERGALSLLTSKGKPS